MLYHVLPALGFILIPQADPSARANGQAPSPAPASQPASRPAGAATTFPCFATAAGGKLLGLPDAAATQIRDLRAGEPLIVVGQQGSIYEVEVPGGISAWIYSAYLRDGADGTVEVIENGVNLRPQPKSDARTVPIARAMKGQKFTSVGRSGDWVQVLGPKDLHGYALLTDLNVTNDPPSAHETELAAGRRTAEDARVAAVEAEKKRKEEDRKRREEEEKRREAARKESQARSQCAHAMDLLRGTPGEAARTQAKELLDAAAKLSSSEAVAADVKRGYERIDLAAFLEKEKGEEETRIAKERESRAREADERVKRVQDILDRQKDPAPLDPFGARFAAIGEVQRSIELPRGRVFTVMKGGRLLFYLSCPSKRYDLGDFLGREVGVVGAVKQVEGYPARMIEVERLEVLSN